MLWLSLGACGGTLDAGSDQRADAPLTPETDLPVDASSSVILCNDGPVDNWQGEFAVLFASAGLDLRGVIINDSPAWQDLNENASGWNALWEAAGASGIAGLPELTLSGGTRLVKPASGQIEDTVPNRSEGAQLIVQVAGARDTADPPVAVVTGGRLTDVADAYLMAPEIAERVVVVASLGEPLADGAHMGIPNGEMDPWANTIVLQRLRYVQVSGFYDQLATVPDARLPELPDNPLGEWIESKQSQVWALSIAADQVALLTLAVPGFARQVEHVRQTGTDTVPFGETPTLGIDASGEDWLVSSVDGAMATERFWTLLGDAF